MAKKIPLRQCVGPERKMEEAHIFVSRESALKRHGRIKDWNGLSK